MAGAALAVIQARRQLRRERIFRDRTRPLDYLDNPELLERYRFRRDDIIYIIGLVEEKLAPKKQSCYAISAESKVLLTLRYVAKSSFYSENADLHGVSRSSHSIYLHETIDAIRRLAPRFITFPSTPNELAEAKLEFSHIANFPNTLGAIDGTQIAVTQPRNNEDVYVNRKGYHSINCQAICSANLRFLNLVAKYPGSTHDSFIWNDCSIRQQFLNGDFGDDSWLVGDSGYPQRSYMMVPYTDPTTAARERYNRAQIRTRNPVERLFGVWKSRFRCIHKSGGALQLQPDRACRLIQATAVLHNIAIDRNTPLLEEAQQDGEDGRNVAVANYQNATDREGQELREALVNQRFAN